MSTLIKLLQHGRKSTTVRWAGIFGSIWALLLGLDWANVSPEFLEGAPEWTVLVFGIVQSVMMAIKRAQTDTDLEDK